MFVGVVLWETTWPKVANHCDWHNIHLLCLWLVSFEILPQCPHNPSTSNDVQSQKKGFQLRRVHRPHELILQSLEWKETKDKRNSLTPFWESNPLNLSLGTLPIHTCSNLYTTATSLLSGKKVWISPHPAPFTNLNCTFTQQSQITLATAELMFVGVVHSENTWSKTANHCSWQVQMHPVYDWCSHTHRNMTTKGNPWLLWH